MYVKKENLISLLVDKLEADGLIVHINPLQEWFQAEGDRLKRSPLETITSLCEKFQKKIIVKEVYFFPLSRCTFRVNPILIR